MSKFTVTPEFKTQASTILTAKKFSAVYPYMNLINREGFTYDETELNTLLNFIGEFSYNEVAEFFQGLSKHVKPTDSAESADTSMKTVSNEVEATEVEA
jgi:hypothetical protein